MHTILNKWRIGEKIGFGFGLVGLLFLIVIWQYHSTLKNSLDDYQYLIDSISAKKDNVLNIELGLLNARQAEKNFLLKRQPGSSLAVSQQIQKTLHIVENFSEIDASSKQESESFKVNLVNYLEHFKVVESAWRRKGLDENSGLQGSFRNSAHALEEMISSMQHDKIYIDLLQLRRREKDYLLRGDERYVDLTLDIVQSIQKQIESSTFDPDNRHTFLNLLTNYENDFTALVEQNNHINNVVITMENVATDVSNLVNRNVERSNQLMDEMAFNIKKSFSEREVFMLWLVIVAIALGVYIAVTITIRIVKPLRKMVTILKQLTFTEVVDKMPYQAEGRDEVNAMAGSLNILADHRKRFITWWESSMDESDACTRFENKLEDLSNNEVDSLQELQEIQSELMDALAEKKQLLLSEHQEIQNCNDEILRLVAILDHPSLPRQDIDDVANNILYKANLINKSLEMVSYRKH